MIGTVRRNAAPMVPDEVRLSKPVHSRVTDITATRDSPMERRRIRGESEMLVGGVEIDVVLMLHSLLRVRLALVQRS